MSKPKPILYVEGPNDCFTVINLMMTHGVDWPEGDEPVKIEPKKSVDALLDCMSVAVKTAVKNKRDVGFVLDIDHDVSARWASVESRLKNGGLELDGFSPDENGIVLQVGDVNVGVWLMPDNVSPKGRLEEFLSTLIPQEDGHYKLAKSFVADAAKVQNVVRPFKLKDSAKAELAAYLAVKDPPGVTYGNAIKARMFSESSETALRFVAWFKKLYRMP